MKKIFVRINVQYSGTLILPVLIISKLVRAIYFSLGRVRLVGTATCY